MVEKRLRFFSNITMYGKLTIIIMLAKTVVHIFAKVLLIDLRDEFGINCSFSIRAIAALYGLLKKQKFLKQSF